MMATRLETELLSKAPPSVVRARSELETVSAAQRESLVELPPAAESKLECSRAFSRAEFARKPTQMEMTATAA